MSNVSLKNILKATLPRQGLNTLKKLRALYYRGQQYYCPFCKKGYRRFLPGGVAAPLFQRTRVVGGGYHDNCMCPGCGSNERERLVGVYLQKHTTLFEKPQKLLHMAPEHNLAKLFSAVPSLTYVKGDKDPKFYDQNTVEMDITCLPFQDHFFDVVICNHVLEHVPDDKAAMSEIYRVLKPGGWAMLQVPLAVDVEHTHEDFSIQCPREREFHFGQCDHVRLYGRDYFERLQQVGFQVMPFSWSETYGLENTFKLGIDPQERLCIAKKKESGERHQLLCSSESKIKGDCPFLLTPDSCLLTPFLPIMRRIIIALALFLPMLIWCNPSEQVIKDQMKADLDIIRQAFDVQYAMKEWKSFYAGWDLDFEINKAKEKIQQASPITVKAYQRAVKEFFQSTQDYHVSVHFFSTETASLPFRVKGVNGKYFVTFVAADKLSASAYPLQIGDEIVTFGGRPTDEVVQEIVKTSTRHANEATDRYCAEHFLTFRSGKVGDVVPFGPIMIGVKHADGDKIYQMQLIWDYTPECITHGLKGKSKEKPSLLIRNPTMLAPHDVIFQDIAKVYGEGNDLLAARQSYIPYLGKVRWETDKSNPFHAYVYEAPDGHFIGYVRISSYSAPSNNFFTENAKAFADIIEFFEERTDALVIDQINNPGGQLLYGYALMSTLTDQPLVTPKERITLTQDDVAMAIHNIDKLERVKNEEEAKSLLGDYFCGLPVTYQLVRFFIDYDRFIMNEWKSGRQLTNPYFTEHVDYVLPHPSVHYSKPILFLINEGDMSCGDYIPAILQDNKRVTLMGTRTAGAGGYVIAQKFINRFGVARFSYTGSIAERLNHNPIENLGVTPDIPYSLTENDLKDDFKDYVKAINEAVMGLYKSEE